jgi:hypothetical protein
MAGGFVTDQRRRDAMLWGMWVESSVRCHGVGRRLVEAVAAGHAMLVRSVSSWQSPKTERRDPPPRCTERLASRKQANQNRWNPTLRRSPS